MPQFKNQMSPILLGLVLIVLLGAFLRLNVTLHTTVLAPLRADAGEYFSYAYNLEHHGVYSRQLTFLTPGLKQPIQPDAMRSPGYSLFLLPFAASEPTNKTILDITLMQAFLGILMVPMAYLLGAPILSGGWRLLPPLLVAISPQLVLAGTFVLSETLFTFLFLLVLIAIQQLFINPQKLRWGIVGGALLAAAALTRPTVQYLLPLIALCIYLMVPASNRLKQMAGMIGGFFLVFGPWLIRNYFALGILSDPTLSVSTILHGHYPNFMYQGNLESLGYPYRFDPDVAIIGSNLGSVLSEILRLFITEPLTYLRWYLIGKPLAFFSWGDVASTNEIFTYPTLQSPYLTNSWFTTLKDLMRMTHAIWMLLGLVAAGICWKNGLIQIGKMISVVRVFSVVVLYFVVVHMAGFPIARYCIPLLPVMFILAAFALSMLAAVFFKHPFVSQLQR